MLGGKGDEGGAVVDTADEHHSIGGIVGFDVRVGRPVVSDD
jgi:hypothetical protein